MEHVDEFCGKGKCNSAVTTRFLKRIRRLLGADFSVEPVLDNIRREVEKAKMLDATILINQLKSHGPYEKVHDAEFRVFSQFGDDGIIQYLIHEIRIEPHVFIEFGVEDYVEANTRLLLEHNNWKGLVIDAREDKVDHIKRRTEYWKYDLTAVAAFVDRENINRIFLEHGFQGEIGILSIDIDGNDYHIWKAIDVVSPVLVIVEYNSVFGARHAITVPYDPQFRRTHAHPSNLYFGASLKALWLLAEQKGYAFVGSNSAGNNAYFVKKSMLGELKALGVKDGYVESKFRESRGAQGQLTYIRGEERLEVISDMVVDDVERNAVVTITQLA